MRAYAISEGICTQCFSRAAEKERVQCLKCINMSRTKRGAPPLPSEAKLIALEKKREYRRKALVKKVRNLDKIKHAIEKENRND
jgi:hypothetical protein